MQRTKIRRDEHGLYVRTNGSVYRPVVSRWTEHMNCVNRTLFGEGHGVMVAAVPESAACQVVDGDNRFIVERWSSHGAYWDKNRPGACGYPNVPSAECWNPAERQVLNG